MPTVPEDKELEYRALIRRVCIINPKATMHYIQRQLEENGLHLDLEYIGRLRNKNKREDARAIDIETHEVLFRKFQSEYRMAITELYGLLYSKQKTSDRISAASAILDKLKILYEKNLELTGHAQRLHISADLVGVEGRQLTEEELKQVLDALKHSKGMDDILKPYDTGTAGSGPAKPEAPAGSKPNA